MMAVAQFLRTQLLTNGEKLRTLSRNFGKVWKSRRKNEPDSHAALSKILQAACTQCNVYVSQRLRRIHKIYRLYQQAYSDYGKVLMFSPIIKRVVAARPFFALAACGFNWRESGFSDEDIDQQVKDLVMVQNAVNVASGMHTSDVSIPEDWQNILNLPEIKIWRYPHAKATGCDLSEYKVHGTFTDISARLFFNIQVDMDYRKKWDDLVVKLDVIEENRLENEQVLQWVSRLPYPFAPREYLCVRRTVIDDKNKVMVISSKAVSHPSCPPSPEYVRVTSYVSHMVIRPHKSFDDLGFDYLMTYCDDPQIVLPSRLASWVVSAGIPEYITKLHDACLNFNKTRRTPPNMPNYMVN